MTKWSQFGVCHSVRIALPCVALLSLVTSTASAATGWQDYQWLQPGVSLQKDNAGNVLSLSDDQNGASLQKFNSDGIVPTGWPVLMPSASSGGVNEQFLNVDSHILVDSANNAYVDSYFDDRSINASLVVTKISANGTVAWGGGKIFSIGPVNSSEHIDAGPMAIGSDGSIYVVGRSSMTPGAELTILLRINPTTGAEVNRRTVASTTDLTPGMNGTILATDTSGNVYYGGPQGLWSYSQNLQTQRWTQALMPRAVVVDSANSALYITGMGNPTGLSYNMFVKRLSTATGAVSWTATGFGNQTHAQSYPGLDSDGNVYGGNRIVLDGSGQVYAAGYGTDGTYNGGLIAKFNPSSGARAWIAHYGASNVDASVTALTVDNLNYVYVSGQETGSGQSSPVAAAREILNPVDGSVLWQRASVDALGESVTEERVSQVVVDGNGNTFWQTFSNGVDGTRLNHLDKFGGFPIPDGTYVIVGLNSGLALDNPGSSHTVGTQMDQWTVNTGANQKWALTNLGGNAVRLVNQASGLTLAERGTSHTNGTAVEQTTWTGANNQQWIVAGSSTLGYFTLTNVNSGQVLDVASASKSTGALIDQWPSSGGANQKWHFQ